MTFARICFLVVFPALLAFPQTNIGRISGSVTDSTGAAVADCPVEAVDAKGLKLVTRTDASGDYLFPSLSSGTYELRVEKQGFRSARETGVVLDAASQRTVSFRLEVGQLSETVNVSSSAEQVQTTSGIREQDAKGRHTTTSRQMFALASGAWVIDTPGMRELKLGSMEAAVSAVFDDIETLARECRFRDCRHHDDAGCGLQAAVATGRLDARRLDSYRKLVREAERASQSVRERRAIERRWGRMHRITSRRGPGTSRE